MARERLAALRAQRDSTIPSSQQPAESGPQSHANVEEQYEMSEPRPRDVQQPGDTLPGFYSEIGNIQDSLRTLNSNVANISILHSRSLDNVQDPVTREEARRLDALVEETLTLINNLKGRISRLQQKVVAGKEGQIRKQQTGLVRRKLAEAIQNYQQVERQYREKYKQLVERQFKIVKPDATPEEVTAVVNDDQPGPIFMEALQSSTRYGEARTAYREVQTRQGDIRRIEKTLDDLTGLFNDMSLIVEQQDETIETVEETGVDVERSAQAGLDHTKRAVRFARAARRKRWICFFIVLIVLVIIAIVVGVTVPKHSKH